MDTLAQQLNEALRVSRVAIGSHGIDYGVLGFGAYDMGDHIRVTSPTHLPVPGHITLYQGEGFDNGGSMLADLRVHPDYFIEEGQPLDISVGKVLNGHNGPSVALFDHSYGIYGLVFRGHGPLVKDPTNYHTLLDALKHSNYVVKKVGDTSKNLGVEIEESLKSIGELEI